MGELKNCPVCGKVFVKIVKNLCPDCIEAEERDFSAVRDHIKDNPGSSVEQIIEATEVDEKKILRWIREGRIECAVGAGSGIYCKSCGAPISIGELCSKCSKELVGRLNKMSGTVANVPAKDETEEATLSRRMFVANRLRNSD